MNNAVQYFKLCAAAASLCVAFSVSANPATTFVQEGFKETQSSMNKVSDSKVEEIRNLVNEAEATLQVTLDDLTAKKDSFAKDWNNIEEGFVYYSRTEADYMRTLLEHEQGLCTALGKGDCAKIAEQAVLENAKDMKDRAELIRKVALKQPVPEFSLKLTEDLENPLGRAIRKTITNPEGKNNYLETTRMFLRLKMTFVGLLDQLALSNKEDYRAKMVEHELALQSQKRAVQLQRLWAVTGQEPIKAKPIGERRRAAMLHEFNIE